MPKWLHINAASKDNGRLNRGTDNYGAPSKGECNTVNLAFQWISNECESGYSLGKKKPGNTMRKDWGKAVKDEEISQSMCQSITVFCSSYQAESECLDLKLTVFQRSRATAKCFQWMTCSPLIKTKISKSQVTLWIMLFPNRRAFSNNIIHFPDHIIKALLREKYWKTVICGATNSFWRLAVFFFIACGADCRVSSRHPVTSMWTLLDLLHL